ncbi:acetyltransferase [Paenibacillus roseipurpureus]|uniref:Acetyltransferase n=1 Tax=Paenibacillus roseopurpureus TaxID=2918901 RepID=A0AA96LKY6_9BACL|nr:acetyltransferase [Paenibacillus sp. MBLB1832]WNR43787.1 acetyltransferase [Paenibacillus sp. MBLB1832]
MFVDHEIIVIGEGGHSKVIREIIQSQQNYRIHAILDDKYAELYEHEGIYKGPSTSFHTLLARNKQLKCVIAIGNNEIRKSIIDRLGLTSEQFITLVHETAVVSATAIIGQGTVVMANTVIHADAHIGDHAIINTGAIVEHDCNLANYVHLAPRATLTGGVVIKEGTFVGAGATIIPGIAIGEWTLVGAGATVIHDVPAYRTAVGTPARIIDKANRSS